MEKTAKPMIAGICSIVSGGLGILLAIGLLVGSSIVGNLMMGAVSEMRMMSGIFIGMAIPLLIVSIIAIVGGVYALKRRIWGLALAGGILAIFSFYPPIGLGLGIAAIVLLVLAKGEFA